MALAMTGILESLRRASKAADGTKRTDSGWSAFRFVFFYLWLIPRDLLTYFSASMWQLQLQIVT